MIFYYHYYITSINYYALKLKHAPAKLSLTYKSDAFYYTFVLKRIPYRAPRRLLKFKLYARNFGRYSGEEKTSSRCAGYFKRRCIQEVRMHTRSITSIHSNKARWATGVCRKWRCQGWDDIQIRIDYPNI